MEEDEMSIPTDDAGLTKWIFSEPDANGAASRWEWADEWLLGDMRTFLVGAQQVAPTRQAFGGTLGGGNFSIPLLFTMALEFLGKLHEGDTFNDKGYVAAYNVSRFMHHFRGHGQQFCSLLWEFTRNGLHHAFRPHRLAFQGIANSTLGYVLTSHPEHPSILVKVAPDDFYILLNSVDAVGALQDAIEDFANELRNDLAAKQRFAAAFAALDSGVYATRSCADALAAQSRANSSKDTAGNVAVGISRGLDVGRGIGLFSDAKYTMRRGGSVRVEGGQQVFELEPDPPQVLSVDLSLHRTGLTATGAATSVNTETIALRFP